MSKMFDPALHAQAVLSLKESIAALGEGEDAQLLLDMIEGETDFFEVVDRMIAERASDLSLAEAIKTQLKDLGARKQRFEKRADVTKTLLEQAFAIAGLDKIERPGATLFMAKRPAKVVIETESDIPSRFWDEGEPVLNGGRLKEELQGRVAAFAVVIDAGEDALDIAIAAYAEAYPDTDGLAEMAQRVRDYHALPIPVTLSEDATDEEKAAEADKALARRQALEALQRDYTQVPGATLPPVGRGLNIRVA